MDATAGDPTNTQRLGAKNAARASPLFLRDAIRSRVSRVFRESFRDALRVEMLEFRRLAGLDRTNSGCTE
jgi:hypothetical protein